MNDKTWYLSGPMSGIEDHNIPTFEAAARALRTRGMTIVVPHEVTVDIQEKNWNNCMRADIEAMMKCHGIILLPGWSKSTGAKAELAVALSLGFDVLFFAPGSMFGSPGTLWSMER